MPLQREQSSRAGESIEIRALRMAAVHKVQTPERKARRAASQPSVKDEKPRLLSRLRNQRRLMRDIYLLFVRVSETKEVHSLAAEWLLDNYYIIQQALRQIQEDLPERFYRQLPKLANTRIAGLPRIYAIARDLTTLGAGSIDISNVERFLTSYQSISPLTVGELWAVPTMLRMSLIETLTQVATASLEIDALDEGSVGESYPPDVPPDTIVANCIISLRALSVHDWKSFVERASLVHRTLSGDPAGVFASMDFESRDRYRKVIEQISRHSRFTQVEIARQAVALARQAQAPGQERAGAGGRRDTHIGYYLEGQGRNTLERMVGYQMPWSERLRRVLTSSPTVFYLGAILLLTLLPVLALTFLAFAALQDNRVLLLQGWLVPLVTAIPASIFAVSLVNWLVTIILPPHTLPKMDFSGDRGTNVIPDHHRALVVIPAILTNASEIDGLIRQLELHYLRNDDPNIAFALLTDFKDAPEKNMPDDELLLKRAVEGMEALRKRYSLATRRSSSQSELFFLLHRERLWNPKEGVWMGWERKRGKLVELNRLLTGDMESSFSSQVGDINRILPVKYIITLDADTDLPQGEAARLVATMAHPLNAPRVDPNTGLVMDGYSVLQPRTEIKLTSANRTNFTQIFSGRTGMDLYTHAVSDAYQDLFGEGVYVGKGIYEVYSFRQALKGKIPENSLLSHDLLEGLLTRTGLASDIVLYEELPPTYQAYTRRQHRWIRGDWQLLPWLLGLRRTGGAMSLIDRWKILDNLRRSLAQPALLLLLVLGWLALPLSPLFWTLLVLVISASPILSGILTQAARNLRPTIKDEEEQSPILRRGADTFKKELLRWLLSLVFLPYEALVALSAAGLTLIRLLVTRRKMLEWTPSAHEARPGKDMPSLAQAAWRDMIWSVLLASIVLLAVILMNPSSLLLAIPFAAAWILAPQVAAWISGPVVQQAERLDPDDTRLLRGLARRTWYFFEQFVGPEDNWLPPDHFQESPRSVVAHRTSPTNIGLGMLSTLSAYDLGYAGLEETLLRLENTMNSLDQLEKYRGHVLNWYDTRDLSPLPPRYVSTVDSGNLVGCFIALREGLVELRRASLSRQQRWEGLQDTLGALVDTLTTLENSGTKSTGPLRSRIHDLQTGLQEVYGRPEDWPGLISQLSLKTWPDIEHAFFSVIDAETDVLEPQLLNSLRVWIDRVRYHLSSMSREQKDLYPWQAHLAEPPEVFTRLMAGSQSWQTLGSLLPPDLTLERLINQEDLIMPVLDQVSQEIADLSISPEEKQIAQEWTNSLTDSMKGAIRKAHEVHTTILGLSDRLERYAWETDFAFLYDRQRNIFHIGYNIDAERMDANYYDLLASESRIASLIAIAKDDVPVRHWMHLGRPVTQIGGDLGLLSWSGTMFEYLMPPLIMREHPGTLLAQSSYSAARRQIEYGEINQVPWGISESGFYYFDNNQNYQYRAFGVPGLGFKRGLPDDLVIAPYASVLALPYFPHEVVRNIKRLTDKKLLTDFGLYEAIDYTPQRLPLGEDYAVVRSFMAHHQGMILLALFNYLQSNRMVDRFHANTRIQSVEMLLQEQVPSEAPIERLREEDEEAPAQINIEPQVIATSWRVPLEGSLPRAHYLSNGRYGLLLTNRGGGYSQWNDRALTRWRADTTLDDWGTFLYVQDMETNRFWTVGSSLVPADGGSMEVFFSPHKVEYHCDQEGIKTHVQVTVSPDEDAEIRMVRLSNTGDNNRHLSITSYGEVVLAPQDADRRHPAFNKLVIESELNPGINGLVFHRRPRAANDPQVYMLHSLMIQPFGDNLPTMPSPHFETSRERFIGRGRTLRSPQMFDSIHTGSHSNHLVVEVLDPVFSIRQEFVLQPHTTVELAYITLGADSRPAALAAARRLQNWQYLNRAFSQMQHISEIEMRRLEIESGDIEKFQKLLSVLVYPQPMLRAEQGTLTSNQKGQNGLWAFGISGDYPILLISIGEREEVTVLRELLSAHAYWRARGLMIDLVILTEKESGYGQEVHTRIHQFLERTQNIDWLNRRGGIFLVRRDQLNEQDQILLFSVARAVLSSSAVSLGSLLQPVDRVPIELPGFIPVTANGVEEVTLAPVARPEDLLMDNGWGGFSQDGKEYQIYLHPGHMTPAPWINVIANDKGGFWVSETGGGYTWAINSGENRLTPWSNDPVSDKRGEAIYLRDEETAEVWSPTPLPAGEDAPYLVRHGAGYSIFEHHSHGLRQVMTLFTSRDDPLKIVRLRLENATGRSRRLTATYYLEWVLGVNRDQMQPYIITEYDHDHFALLARNPYNVEFQNRVAFLASGQEPHGLTADRTEFLGRSGSYQKPAALFRVGLSGEAGAGVDPCAAIQVHIDLSPGETQEIFFLVGQGSDREDALRIIEAHQSLEKVAGSFEEVTRFWEDLLSTVQVSTPDPAMNFALNRWLLYQDLSCRVWGRSGLYQSSGAFGFRDQLQDVMALSHAAPEIARRHILYAAAHQFEEGDVLHWWHPPSGRGVRTHIRDDLLWLPYVTAEYIEATGDTSILDEKITFLTGETLEPGEDDRYGQYQPGDEAFSLYEHCRRAILNGFTQGPHNLPLIGAGDWNDGMNRVGIEGKGESVWLGWFLYATLSRFEPICRFTGDDIQAEDFQNKAEQLRQALNENAWDGEWFLRAYYDNGQPMGSAQSEECKIDSIAQSWAVLSGAADPARARQAMQSVIKHLLQEEGRLLRLFKPPFNKTPNDPGYIKAYPPGVRENGGQYTHAAIWSVWAFAELGEGGQAMELFELLNPLTHGENAERASQYRVEPYVVAADVYSEPPHIGRGGWTWYTGSAGWMYRLGVEALLGLRRLGNLLIVDPCIPSGWQSYDLTYQYGSASYKIRVENPAGAMTGVESVEVDGKDQPERAVTLKDDGREHQVIVRLAPGAQRLSIPVSQVLNRQNQV